MAKNKPTPLKNEEELPLKELAEKLDHILAIVSKQPGEQQTVAPAIDSKVIADFSATVCKAVKKALDDQFDRRDNLIVEYERKMKAEGKMSFQEYVNTLTKRYATAIDKCERMCDTVKDISEILSMIRDDSLAASRDVRDFGKKLDMAVHAQRNASTLLDNRPAMPKSHESFALYILRDLPLYWLKRLYRSRHVRQFIAILLLCSWLVSVGLTCFIAHDNAQLRKTEQEYIELRQWVQGQSEKQANR